MNVLQRIVLILLCGVSGMQLLPAMEDGPVFDDDAVLSFIQEDPQGDCYSKTPFAGLCHDMVCHTLDFLPTSDVVRLECVSPQTHRAIRESYPVLVGENNVTREFFVTNRTLQNIPRCIDALMHQSILLGTMDQSIFHGDAMFLDQILIC